VKAKHNIKLINNPFFSTNSAVQHGRRKDFFQGGHQVIFPKFLQGGPKVVKFVFSHSKLRKQPFLPKCSKSRGAKALLPTSLPTSMQFSPVEKMQYLERLTEIMRSVK